MKKFTKFLAVALLLVMSLIGCQAQITSTTTPQTSPAATAASTTTASTTTASTTTTEVTTTPATQPTQTADPAALETVYPYEFTTAEGGKVVLDKEPQRIVSLSPTYTEIVFALGAGSRLVGRTDYCDFPAEAAQVPSVGSMTQPSVEKIVELKPDVILVSFMEKEMVDKIQQAGTKVIQMASGDSIEGSFKNMLEIAKVLNTNAAGGQLVQGIKAEIAAIHEKIKSLDPVTAYYVAGFGQSGDYTAGDKTFMNDLIAASGGKNVAKDAEGWSYTAEKLLEKDPEYIIIGSMAQMTDAFKTTEPYKNLTAVKENRLKEIDDNLISREGPRMAQGVKLMAEIFHPEAFK